MIHVPTLPPGCGSWVVIDREDGFPVFEVFSKEIAKKVDPSRFVLKTASDYLASLNRHD